MMDGYVASDLLRGSEIPTTLLAELPKAELHVHLDGSLRLSTFMDLSEKHSVPWPGGSAEAAAEIIRTQPPGHTLENFLTLFDHVHRVLQTGEDLRRVAREIAEDCAAENVLHVELRFSPILHTAKGLSLEAATDAVLEGLADATASTGISTGLLITGLRHRTPAETLEMAHVAVAYKGKGVTGFDLAGIEVNNPAKEHREAFYLILNHNINCTVHAGEEFGPASIRQALHYLGAHRIGHGTRLLEDESLLQYVADHRIPVEVGLTSNVRTGVVPDVASHPLRKFLRAGLRVCMVTNNRLFLANTLTQELRKAADTFDFSLLELENIVISGFKSAFLPQKERAEMMRRAVEEMGEIRRRHGLETAE